MGRCLIRDSWDLPELHRNVLNSLELSHHRLHDKTNPHLELPPHGNASSYGFVSLTTVLNQDGLYLINMISFVPMKNPKSCQNTFASPLDCEDH